MIFEPVPWFRVVVRFFFLHFFLHPAEKTAQLQALIILVEEGVSNANKHHLVLGDTFS